MLVGRCHQRGKTHRVAPTAHITPMAISARRFRLGSSRATSNASNAPNSVANRMNRAANVHATGKKYAGTGNAMP
jgi:hypothetical protein